MLVGEYPSPHLTTSGKCLLFLALPGHSAVRGHSMVGIPSKSRSCSNRPTWSEPKVPPDSLIDRFVSLQGDSQQQILITSKAPEGSV